MSGKIFVYRGEGAGWRSVRSTCESLERLMQDAKRMGPMMHLRIPPYQVTTLSAAELLDGSWQKEAVLLVMPGGADLPYCKHLNGRGNKHIKEYVQGGGGYLGLCAGAYYACSRVVFEPGTPLEVVGDRELSFFPGTARGAAFPGFDYLTEAGSVATQVEFRVPALLAQQCSNVMPGITSALQQQTFEAAASVQQQDALAASMASGASAQPPELANGSSRGSVRGRNTSSACHWALTTDYCNGGPYFTAVDGSSDVEQLPGVSLLATYCQGPALPINLPAAQQQPASVGCSPTTTAQLKQQQQQPFERRPAAVRCKVGKGVAVLCGTHPELGPEWLDPCGESSATKGPRPHAAAIEAAETGAACASVSGQPVTLLRPQGSSLAAGQPRQQQEGYMSSPQVQQLDRGCGEGLAGDGSSRSCSSGMAVVCPDVQLAAHAQELRRQLEAAQQMRDLFLSCLVLEALQAC